MANLPPQADEIDALVERARTSQARIVTEKGDMVFGFFPDDAPVHCAAFIKLTDAGFYDGLAFH
ncbi:MAG: peptidylprolyl isomerase, partial [Candidatus Eremiobacteraeota bacterium]|nr:peptidylprolyl isomerase [Candidatus Eremiobacteraeota bacterium]